MDGRYFILLLLPLSVYGKKTEVTFCNNAEEILQKTGSEYEATQAQRKQFMEDFMGQTFDTPPRATLTYYESTKINKDYDNIYRAFLKENNKEIPFVLKTKKAPNNLENAQMIEKALLNKVGKKDAEYGYLQGLSFINTKSGSSSERHFVNKLVQGPTLKDAISGDIPLEPYKQGAPDNLKEALLRAATLIFGLAAIHHIGYNHNDPHSQNIIIENNPELGYPCRIIDFELIKKIQSEPDQSDTQETDFSVENRDFECIPIDIHDALAYILFGKYNNYSPKKIHRNTGDKSDQFFSERVPLPLYRHFSFINKLMERNLHRSYPEPILRRLVILIVSLLSPYPEDRPTFSEILEELQDMALADWDNGHYSIQ